MKNTESKQILEYLKRIDESINGPRPTKKPSSDDRPLSERISGLDKKIGTSRSKQPLAGQVDSLTDKFRDLGTKVTDLGTKVTDLGTKVTDLDTKVTDLDTKVTDLDTKVTDLDTKVTAIDKKIGTSQRNLPVAVQLDALDRKVEHRFDAVDRRIESARVEIVDLVDRVHGEVTGRVIDLEKAGPGRKGNGGRGSGGGGVPLAS